MSSSDRASAAGDVDVARKYTTSCAAAPGPVHWKSITAGGVVPVTPGERAEGEGTTGRF